MRNRRNFAFISGALLCGGFIIAATACGPPPVTTPTSYPDPESPGAKLLVEKCVGCHGAPTPSLHTATEWTSVLYRMQNRMMQKGKKTLTSEETALLLAYLQKHAGAPS